jgi:hypothetical protein
MADQEMRWLSARYATWVAKLVAPIASLVFLAVTLRTALAARDSSTLVGLMTVGGAVLAYCWIWAGAKFVGYRGTQLVVASTNRQTTIPFENIAGVDSPWWGKGSIVQIRFRKETEFGLDVWYIPAWAVVMNTFWSHPEERLQRIIETELSASTANGMRR